MLPIKARQKLIRIVEAAQDAQDQLSAIMRRLSDNQRALGSGERASQHPG